MIYYLNKIVFDKILERRRNGRVKEWVEVPFPMTTGFVIGFRTLSNGTIQDWGEDGGIEYRQTGSFKALLVVFDPTRKPVLLKRKDQP
jgi:hypothetical protein